MLATAPARGLGTSGAAARGALPALEWRRCCAGSPSALGAGGRHSAQWGAGGHFPRNENAMAENQGHGQKTNGWVMISDKQNTTAKKIALHERGDGVDPLLWRKTGAKRNKIHEGKMPENCVLE